MSNSTTIALIKKIGGGGGGGNVPDPEVADIGKVLGIVEDGTGAKYAPVEGGGSGLPDPTSLTDGTAIVAVNGEWKMQEGYGYTDEPAFEPITWDGDKEGRASVNNTHFKVSNVPIRKSEIIGSTFYFAISGEEPISETIEVTEDMSDDFYFAGENYSILVAFAPGEVSGMPIPEAGVYFSWLGSGEYSLTAPPSVHQFDSALIPSSGGAVNSVNGKTGAVVLDAEDVGALPDDTPLFSGDYDDLTNKPTIPSIEGLATETFVTAAISAAIGDAIGGSY